MSPFDQILKVDDRKGIFTKEIEEALLSEKIDLAVHSFKDLPSEMDPRLQLAGIPERVFPFDVILVRKDRLRGSESDAPFDRIPETAAVGTSSARRMSQLAFCRPGTKIVPLRGNVPTRIGKVISGEVDAALLARAGIERLRRSGFFDAPENRAILEQAALLELTPNDFVPAPAQGALGLQCRAGDTTTLNYARQLADTSAEDTVRAERLVLAGLSGGCHLPLGAHCVKNSDVYTLDIFLGSEAEDNRKKRSYVMRRHAPTADILAERILKEMRAQLPIVLTGREDRILEIVKTRKQAPLVSFPLIRIEKTGNPIEMINMFRMWKADAGRSGKRTVIAAMSAPGVDALADLLKTQNENASGSIWAVTGDRTAERIRDRFPGADIGYMSPDGTGEGLARHLASAGNFAPHVFAVSAERGREEFNLVLQGAGIRVTRILPYRSEAIERPKNAYLLLPDECFVVFGSPSSALTFLRGIENAGRREDGFRYGALGPTTARAVRELGRIVYAESKTTDYDSFVGELL